MTNLSDVLLGLTLLAWGNSLPDLNANISMTKKGFGEMAVTGCLAGPIFNILTSMGISSLQILYKQNASFNDAKMPWEITAKDGSFDPNFAVCATLLIGNIVVILTLMFVGARNKWTLNFKSILPGMILYVVVVVGLSIMLIVYDNTH